MNLLHDAREQAVGDCLARLTATTGDLTGGRWTFTLPGFALEGTARHDAGWLLLNVPLPAAAARSLTAEAVTRLVRWNAVLERGVKFALETDCRRLTICAEFPLGETGPSDVDVEPVIGDAFRGFEQGLHAFEQGAEPLMKGPDVRNSIAKGSERTSPVTALPNHSDGEHSPPAEALKQLCEAAGWPVRERSGGRLAVPLDVPGAFHQAVIAPAGDGFRAVIAFEPPEPLSTAGRQAIDLLLLTACRVVRMARAATDSTTCFWEAAGHSSVLEFGEALSALSVACRLTARELKLLNEETIAREYLRVRGWSP